MYKVTLPSNTLYVTSALLPNLLATLADTRYVAESGEFLRTTTQHELASDSTTATLLIKTPVETVRKERDQYMEMWKDARDRLAGLEERLEKLKEKVQAKAKNRR